MSKLWKNPPPTTTRSLMLTPLIDIIFLITIFFMINASFSLNPSFDVDLPDALTGESVLDDQFVVTLTPPNRIFLGDQETSLPAFPGLLDTQTAQWSTEQRTAQKVLVKGDETLPYGFLMRILDILRKNGLTNIALVTERGED
jgi:biopolymer transport protein ExbD